MAVGDFNGDGIPDLVVANVGDLNNNGQGGSVAVLLGNGDGTFQAAVNYAVGPAQLLAPSPLAVTDFNGDGIADLAVACGSGVRVLLGNGDGTFRTPPISYVAGVRLFSVAVGDFNRDGLPDLAVANYDSNGGVSILINDGKWVP